MMHRRVLGSVALLGTCLLTAVPGHATPWEFGPPTAVSGAAEEGVYHSLDSPARAHIAASAEHVGIVWADNQSGGMEAYMVFKAHGESDFASPVRLSSGDGAGYDPGISVLEDGRFLLTWEDGEHVWAAVTTPELELTEPIQLSESPARQPVIAGRTSDTIVAAWSESQSRGYVIRAARLHLEGDGVGLQSKATAQVEADAPETDQIYPAVAVSRDGAVVAWEDRRHGHTRIYAAQAPLDPDATEWDFGAPAEVNEVPDERTVDFGAGHGVTRIALSSYDNYQQIAATWLDKRDFRSGYDPYVAFWEADGFGANQPVLDPFGADASQWHAAIAGDPAGDQVLIAWDDDRDEIDQVFLTWRGSAGDWGEDVLIPTADPDRLQTQPAVALDPTGNVHIVWVERGELGAPTELRYAVGWSHDD